MIKRAFVILGVLAVQVAAASASQPTIVVLGDSLSSGYGLNGEPSWVALLEDRLEAEAYGYEVVNASIAGDTSSGGLARLGGLLERYEPAIVIIELGGNDGLRGQSLVALKQNLASIIELTQAHDAQPILVGIQIPPNYGPQYTESFASIYRDLAAAYSIPLVAFLMDGVALHPDLMQGDRMHPNSAGQAPMLENVWPILAMLL
jgi:acyl-CoA thioesterase I